MALNESTQMHKVVLRFSILALAKGKLTWMAGWQSVLPMVRVTILRSQVLHQLC